MNLATRTIWIARTPDDVFDFFLDFSQASRWRQFVQSMEVLGSGPIGVGSRVRTTFDLMGGRHTMELEVLAIERPRLWRHRTFETDFNGYVEYRFETEGEGTRVWFTIAVKPAGLYGWLGLPLVWMGRRHVFKEQLPQLKCVMEQQ